MFVVRYGKILYLTNFLKAFTYIGICITYSINLALINSKRQHDRSTQVYIYIYKSTKDDFRDDVQEGRWMRGCIWGACVHQFWRGGCCVGKRDIILSDMSTQTYNSR